MELAHLKHQVYQVQIVKMKFSKAHIWIAISVLVIIVAFSFYFYKKGKKTTSIQDLPGDLPNSTNQNNNPAGVSNSEILQLVSDLYEDMNGVNFWGHDNSLFQKLLTYSDTDFVKVYNTFNSKYQADSGETFTQWLTNETNVTGNFMVLKESILNRCAKLNLR